MRDEYLPLGMLCTIDVFYAIVEDDCGPSF